MDVGATNPVNQISWRQVAEQNPRGERWVFNDP